MSAPDDRPNARLGELNALPEEAARTELLRCCGSRRWAIEMAALRPFASVEALHARAIEVWRSLGEEDWLEALAAHPRIGSKRDVAAQSHGTRTWADGEQAGTRDAHADVLAAIAEANAAYEAKFGFVYVVCATGKSASEMLDLCRARLGYDRATELRIAADEQRKITAIRLDKLLAAT